MTTSVLSAALCAALPIALALTAAGCQPAQPTGHGGPSPAVVAVMAVEPKDVPATYEYVAQTAGFREVEVRARVTGILLKRNYREGTYVRKGESLFTIDPVPFETTLARVEADLAMAEARLAQARRELARLRPVLEMKAVSQKELDDAASAEQVANAEVKSAQSRVREARLNLEYTRVEAPISGYASRAVASEGSLVSGPNVLLTTVTQVDPMYVIFGIPDREYLALRRDVQARRLKLPENGRFKASLKLADGSTYAHSGTLNFTDVRVNAQTGTSEARAEIPNPGGLLRAGEFARILLHGAIRPGATVVPQRAVLEGPKGKFVYVVSAESKAEVRPVEVGDWTDNGWIINDGLTPSDRVIVDGVMKLGPGAPVRLAEGGAPSGAGKTGEKTGGKATDKVATRSAGTK
jgi:membrane fusion protein (multidrug efflux system)